MFQQPIKAVAEYMQCINKEKERVQINDDNRNRSLTCVGSGARHA